MPFAPAHLPPATSAACERSAPRGSTVDRTSDAVLPRGTRHEFRARALGNICGCRRPCIARRQGAPRPSLRARTTIPWDRDK